MNNKTLAVVLAVLSAVAVIYMEKENTSPNSQFESWKL